MEYHVRAGHISPEHLFGLYRRLHGDSAIITSREIVELLKTCKCHKEKPPSRSGNCVPIPMSINNTLYLDFKSLNTSRAPVHNTDAKLVRLSIFEPLSGACWSFPISKCTISAPSRIVYDASENTQRKKVTQMQSV